MATINNTIDKIEERLKTSTSMPAENKAELLNLLASLKTEITELAKTHAEQAESICGFADSSTREATEKERNSDSLKDSLEGLEASVRDFEISHPRLVTTVNAISTMLSNLGI